MTAHEALLFISHVHDVAEARLDKTGPWCWPLRQTLLHNVRRHRDWFGGTKPSAELVTQLTRLRAHGYIIEGPCQSHCHARHVTITPAGADALKRWNESGCSRACALNPHGCQRVLELAVDTKLPKSA